MLRIQRSANGEVVFTMSGQMDAESIVELETVINLEGKGRRIVLRGHPRVSRWKEAERSHILRILQQTGGVVGGVSITGKAQGCRHEHQQLA